MSKLGAYLVAGSAIGGVVAVVWDVMTHYGMFIGVVCGVPVLGCSLLLMGTIQEIFRR